MPENMLLFSSSKQGLIWRYSNRGEKVSMCHFEEIDLGLENKCRSKRESKNGPPPSLPSPSPARLNKSATRQNILKNMVLMMFKVVS